MIGSDYYWKIKSLSHTLVGMESKLVSVFNGSEAKRSVFKNANILNVIVRNKNSEEADI